MPCPSCSTMSSLGLFPATPNTIFPCRHICEVQREKTIAYAHALQYWVEESNPPTGGQPCQLAESVKELREEMRCYLSFTDHKVFEGVTPLEETIPNPVEESHLASEMDTIVNVPKESATREAPLELAQERKCPKFHGWEKVLHPSQLVAVVGKAPCPSRILEQTYQLEAANDQPTRKVHSETPSPAQELEVVHQWKPTPGFVDITTCLSSQLSKEVLETPPVLVMMGMMVAPGVVTMSSSQVVWDEAIGATYLDTVTTSIGRVALNVAEDEVIVLALNIEDVLDLL